MKINKTSGIIAGIGAIILALFNVVLFVIAGFTDHYASFWISYGAMMLGAIVAAAMLIVFFGCKDDGSRIFIGYPIAKYSVIYIGVELVVSVIFIILDAILMDTLPWSVSFLVQLILMVAYVVLALTCFITKNIINETQNEIKEKTAFTKLLYTDAAMLAESCSDPEAKKQFAAFAEAVRYSDPMSNPILAPLEGEIQSAVTNAKILLESEDVSGAVAACNKATLLLKERNLKCKALK